MSRQFAAGLVEPCNPFIDHVDAKIKRCGVPVKDHGQGEIDRFSGSKLTHEITRTRKLSQRLPARPLPFRQQAQAALMRGRPGLLTGVGDGDRHVDRLTGGAECRCLEADIR